MNPPTGPISIADPSDEDAPALPKSVTIREDVQSRDATTDALETARLVTSKPADNEVELLSEILDLPWDDEVTDLLLRYAECGAYL